MTGLPAPAPGRFKPLRAGLVDLFLYEAQEFPFRDGRLLLRGDNGSGKSKVMALTLPLLLDANLSPARMEPDADPKKQMAWNLLQGDEYEERTGYTWLEFGRVDEAGDEHFVTLGLGVKAVQGRGVVKQWWFLTPQRVGRELHLVDRLRTVLTRERLIDALGSGVHDTAERYRHAVDEALFRLGDRYGPLVDLLVHLRQPQLSKRPDERELARALTESLSPLSGQVVDVVAQSYQQLDDELREVERLRAGADAVRAFTTEYGRYARVAAARAAAPPRLADSALRRAREVLRDAEQAVAAAETAERSAAEAITSGVDTLTRLEAERDALRERRQSDELVQLDHARQRASETREARAAAESSLAGRARDLETAESARADAVAAAGRAADDERERGAELTAALRRLGLRFDEAALVTLAGLDDVAERLERFTGEVTAEALRRRGHLVDLANRLSAAAKAADALARERGVLDAAASGTAEASVEAETAERTASAAATAWLAGSRRAMTAATELRGPDAALEQALFDAEDWAADPSGPDPVDRWARAVSASVRDRLVADRAGLLAETRRLEGVLAAIDAESAELEAGHDAPPPVPHTRSSDRTAREGAPFWAAIDFRPQVPERDRAGVEAALEAAGLLDAWVLPEGLATPDGDVVLLPREVAGPTLRDVLVARPPDGVPEEHVSRLLGSVALAEEPAAPAAVSRNGRFALGPLAGSWSKPAAQYIGATARAEARARRLAELAAERDMVAAQRDSSVAAVAALGGRLARLEADLAALPETGELRRTRAEATARAAALRRAADAEQAVAARVEQRDADARRTAEAVDAAARDYGLPADDAALAELRRDLDALPRDLRDLDRATRGRADAVARSRAAEHVLARATDAAEQAERTLAAARTTAVAAAQRLATLEATVGVAVRELEARLAAVDTARATATVQLEAARRAGTAATSALAVARDRAARASTAVDEATTIRDEATEGLRVFAASGLLAVVSPDLDVPDVTGEWTADPTVRLARRIAEVTSSVDAADEAWDRAGTRLDTAFRVLEGALSAQGVHVVREQRHGVVVVLVAAGTELVAPDVRAADLEDALAERERLLSAREREILENHLVDEVASRLQELVQDAAGQVARMNRELEARPTRSGLRLRIVWEPVEDRGADQARRRLLQRSAATWSPTDRQAVGDFLRDRVEGARIEDPEGTWQERLGAAFDYRSWNRFRVEIHQNGSWRPASGPASGGERVLAASVPLFAAAASHYASAGNPHAPRLILLDEAFAGVDDRSRANYLGLLAEFDLDVMMTSEREWAAYPEVPGIAIAQLFRLPGAKAVHVDHWEWDGTERRRLDDPGMTAVDRAPVDAPDPVLALDLGDA